MKAIQPTIVTIGALTLLAGVGAATPETVQTQAELAMQAGPPSDLPGPVPDFVGDILGAIREFLAGIRGR